MYVAGTEGSVPIRGVSLINSEVLNREVPLYNTCIISISINTMYMSAIHYLA